LWQDYKLTIIMVTHDINEAFGLGTRVLTLDKRRHDPQAPHRFGATVVYDIPLTKKSSIEGPVEGESVDIPQIADNRSITIDTIDNN